MRREEEWGVLRRLHHHNTSIIMLEDKNSKKISDLNDSDAKAHREWVSTVRSHLANEHKRWGEALFRIQILGNTGGVAVVAALMGQGKDYAASLELKVALGAFIAGVLAVLFNLIYEFIGVSMRLKAWDFNMPRYLKGEITFGELYGPEKHLSHLGAKDYFFAGFPLISCFVGCFSGMLFLAKSCL